MADDMLERVARALCRADGIDPDKRLTMVYSAPGHENDVMLAWQEWEGFAQVAVAAMCEPSQAVIEAGATMTNHVIRRDMPEFLRKLGAEALALGVWRAMIDAIRGDAGQGE